MSDRIARGLALVALFFSLAGGALAANHYLITNVHQIKPSVRAKLRGARGPRGPVGPVVVSATALPTLATQVVTSAPVTLGNDPSGNVASIDAVATCPTGSKLLGGGYQGTAEIVRASWGNGSSWEVSAQPDPAATGTNVAPSVQAWALCETGF